MRFQVGYTHNRANIAVNRSSRYYLDGILMHMFNLIIANSIVFLVRSIGQVWAFERKKQFMIYLNFNYYFSKFFEKKLDLKLEMYNIPIEVMKYSKRFFATQVYNRCHVAVDCLKLQKFYVKTKRCMGLVCYLYGPLSNVLHQSAYAMTHNFYTDFTLLLEVIGLEYARKPD